MAEEVKELLVRVSATTELLRSQLTAAERQVASFQNTTEASTRRVEESFRRVGQSAGAQKAGLQQLSLQVGDMATMFSMGARPMQIFASQGSQVVGALGLMAGEATKFGRFMAGPWPQLITAGVLVLSPFISKLFDTADAANTARSALDDLVQAQRKKNAEDLKSTNAEIQLNANRDKAMKLSTLLDKYRAAPNLSNSQKLAAAARADELRALRLTIAEQESAIRAAQPVARSKATAVSRVSRSAGRTVGISTAESPLTREFNTLPSENSASLYKAAEERMRILREGAADDWKQQSEQIRRGAEFEFEQRQEVEAKLRSIRETQLQTLTGLYEDLFRGGTKAIWDDFAQIGQRVIAQVLAKFTLAKVTGGGFDLGSAISGAFTSVLGFADGGRPPLGRVSVVGERGPELFVPDAAGTVIPNHALGGGGPSITINAPGATAETVAMIRREIMSAAPMIAAASTSQTTRVMNRRRL